MDVENTITLYKKSVEDLTLKILFDDYNVEDGSSLSKLSNNELKQIKNKIKNSFYKKFPGAKSQVQAWSKQFKSGDGVSYDNYTYDEKVGSQIGRGVLAPIYRRYNIIQRLSEPSSVSENNSFVDRYEYFASSYKVIPSDKIVCDLSGCSKSTPSYARTKLKEKGFEFENIEIEGMSFWKVVKEPQNSMEQFVSSLSEEQKKMFKDLLNE